jgi:DNA-3-methyladenine glycosylase II
VDWQRDIVTFSLRPKPPFRLERTVWALRRLPVNEMDRWDGETYRRTLMMGESALEAAVIQSGEGEEPELQVRVSCKENAAERVTERSRRLEVHGPTQIGLLLSKLLGLEVDLAPFYRLASDDDRLARLVGRFVGLKPPRFPTVFEAVVNGIACQQLSLNVGIHLLNRLSLSYGRPCGEAHAFPRPIDLAETDPRSLRTMGFSQRKAVNVTAIAQAVTAGELDLESLTHLGDDAAVARLEQLQGIGRWTAQYVALRGLGRLDVFPADDVGSQSKVQHWLSLNSRPGYEEILRLLEGFGPYRGLIYFYLLLDRQADQGLLEMP